MSWPHTPVCAPPLWGRVGEGVMRIVDYLPSVLTALDRPNSYIGRAVRGRT